MNKEHVPDTEKNPSPAVLGLNVACGADKVTLEELDAEFEPLRKPFRENLDDFFTLLLTRLAATSRETPPAVDRLRAADATGAVARFAAAEERIALLETSFRDLLPAVR